MRHFGLIGFPLGHSFSEKYFRNKFEKGGIIDCDYHAFPTESLHNIRSVISDKQWDGFNVTIPYKESILPHLDEIDPVASAIGAVNCVHIVNGKWKGYNTDVYGFEQSIRPFLENKYERALIIGSGGASKAIQFVLGNWNIDYRILSRGSSTSDKIMGYEAISKEAMSFFPLIVNSTPLGTFPQVSEKPMIPYEGITEKHFLYDVVYNPAVTAFLEEGKKRGAHTMSGLRMLELQADRSWEIWNTNTEQ